MRTIVKTTDVYSWEELSEEAKRNAVDEFFSKHNHFWWDDTKDSAQMAADAFGLKMSWDYTDWGDESIKFTFDMEWDFWWLDDDWRYVKKLAGARAIAWIVKRFDFKVLDYSHRDGRKKITDARIKLRWENREYSRTHCSYHDNAYALKRYEDNLPTGYCADYCVIEAYKQFVEEMRKDASLHVEYFFELLGKAFTKEWRDDCKGQEDLEYFGDTAMANDWEFLADGTMYKGA